MAFYQISQLPNKFSNEIISVELTLPYLCLSAKKVLCKVRCFYAAFLPGLACLCLCLLCSSCEFLSAPWKMALPLFYPTSSKSPTSHSICSPSSHYFLSRILSFTPSSTAQTKRYFLKFMSSRFTAICKQAKSKNEDDPNSSETGQNQAESDFPWF